MDRGAWLATVHGVTKSWMQLKCLACTDACTHKTHRHGNNHIGINLYSQISRNRRYAIPLKATGGKSWVDKEAEGKKGRAWPRAFIEVFR